LGRGGFEDDQQEWEIVEAKPIDGGKKKRRKK
jgi:hypothetical protein